MSSAVTEPEAGLESELCFQILLVNISYTEFPSVGLSVWNSLERRPTAFGA